ncbi:MAG: hypothetical protein AAFX78_03450 [Cyanobacteria bacterium J06638_20]
MTVQDVREIKLHEDEDWEVAKEELFGKAYYLAKTVKTAATQANVVGVLKRPLPLEPGQRRRKFDKRFVVRKPNRQEGDKPKERRTVSLDADLVKAADAKAEELQTYFSFVVEDALKAYLQP